MKVTSVMYAVKIHFLFVFQGFLPCLARMWKQQTAKIGRLQEFPDFEEAIGNQVLLNAGDSLY